MKIIDVKLVIIVILSFVATNVVNAQKPVNTPYFILNGSYQNAEKETNEVLGNTAITYNIMSSDYKDYYKINVMKYKNDPTYLDEVNKTKKEKYKVTTFQGSRAIIGENKITYDDGSIAYYKDIMFFKGSYFFNISVLSQSKNGCNSAFLKIQKNFKAKNPVR